MNVERLREDKLAAFNKLTTDLRMQMRHVDPSYFHRVLRRGFQEQRVVQCLTKNIDGLDDQAAQAVQAAEERKGDSSSRVIMMYGDNRWLRCLTASCPGVDAQEAPHIEQELLLGRSVACPPCTEAAKKIRSQRLIGPPGLRFLRPAVQSRMASDLLPGGKLRIAILEAAKKCELLLVVSVSLKCRDTFDLISDIGACIHGGGYGAVVYVGHKPIIGRNTENIDFHLNVNIEEFSVRLLQAMDEREVEDHMEVDSTEGQEQSDRWYEVSQAGGNSDKAFYAYIYRNQVMNNDVPPQVAFEEEELKKPLCCLCNLSVPECLVQCTQCRDYLCYPGSLNPYGKSRACLILRNCLGRPDEPDTKKAIAEFHYVQPAPQLSVQQRNKAAPRMVMFWGAGKRMVGLALWNRENSKKSAPSLKPRSTMHGQLAHSNFS
ncbi:hypothetical protein FRC07_006794 [Ceratobasidium sp. 392]|nr:hypothetical protein FRC07_006794 [Ceratobasidium sp. 392]